MADEDFFPPLPPGSPPSPPPCPASSSSGLEGSSTLKVLPASEADPYPSSPRMQSQEEAAFARRREFVNRFRRNAARVKNARGKPVVVVENQNRAGVHASPISLPVRDQPDQVLAAMSKASLSSSSTAPRDAAAAAAKRREDALKNVAVAPENVAVNAQDPDYAASVAPEVLCRTVVVENLTRRATSDAIMSGLSQFGVVTRVDLPDSLLARGECLGWAIVEMATEENAANVVQQASESLFLMGAVPRPVSIRRAVPEDFPVRKAPGSIKPRLITDIRDGNEGVFRLRNLLHKHQQQADVMHKLQVEEMENLHTKQEDQLRELLALYDKLLDTDKYPLRMHKEALRG